jgi:hypothetical protein
MRQRQVGEEEPLEALLPRARLQKLTRKDGIVKFASEFKEMHLKNMINNIPNISQIKLGKIDG